MKQTSAFPRSSSESGYSLAEMLTVVALIGIISLVSIPNFISLYRQTKVKASLRQFTTELRTLRARAATRNLRQKISFTVDNDPADGIINSYQVYEFRDTDSDGTPDDWVLFTMPNPKPCDNDPNIQCLDDTVYIDSTTVNDDADDADPNPDLIFLSNGTVNSGEIVLRTVSKIAANEYTIEVSGAGRVKVTQGSF